MVRIFKDALKLLLARVSRIVTATEVLRTGTSATTNDDSQVEQRKTRNYIALMVGEERVKYKIVQGGSISPLTGRLFPIEAWRANRDSFHLPLNPKPQVSAFAQPQIRASTRFAMSPAC